MDLLKPVVLIFVAALCLIPAQSQTAAPAVQQLLSEAREYLTAGRFDEAASGFRSVLARRPEMPEALFGLGVACGQLGRLEEAQQALQRYVGMQPSSVEGHSALAMVLLAAGKPTGAKAELGRVLRLDGKNFEAAKALAHIENGEYNGARAARLLEPLAKSPEFDDEARLLLAAAYAQSGNDKLALALAALLVERQPPAPPEAFALAAGSASRAGDAAFAERACALGMRAYLNSDQIEQRCLRIVSMGFINGMESRLRGSAEDVPALILLGRLMTDVAETADAPVRERALKLLEKAVALSPSDAAALYNLGRCLRVLARPEEALPILERALAAHPNEELQTLIYTQIALTEQYLQHDARAENAFRLAIGLNRRLARHMPEPAFSFYSFLVAVNKEQDAAAVLDEILRWDPAFLPARMRRARKLAEAGRLEQAAEQAKVVARNTSPADQELLRAAHILLLQLCLKLGRTEEAARHRAWLKSAQAARRP